MPGVMIHANILDTLFSGIPFRRAPAWVAAALAMVAGGAAGWAATVFRPLAAFLLVAGAALTYLAGTQAAFRWGRLWMDALPVPLALLIPYVGIVAKSFAQEQLEMRRLSRFFSPSVVKEIARQKDDAGLGARWRRMTVLFSDIRGFTSMSERMQPKEVVTFLREYLTVMTDVVFQHRGTVDKYIGDAIIALYNVLFEAPDHAAQAVRTAVEFQERLEPLAERFAANHSGTLAAHPPHLAAHVGGLPGQRDPPCGGRRVVSQRAAYAPRRAGSQAKANIGPRVCLRFRAPQAGAARGRLWLPG